MGPRARALAGLFSTTLLLGVGGFVLAEGRSLVGGALLALGVLRGVTVVRQLREARDGP